MKKIILSGLFPEEICEKLNISQQFRGKQIFKWISKGVSDFSQMTNLSSALREELSQKAEIFSSKVDFLENIINNALVVEVVNVCLQQRL